MRTVVSRTSAANAALVPNLQSFLAQWQAARNQDTLSARLSSFIAKAAPLLRVALPTEARGHLDHQRLSLLLTQLADPLKKSRSAGSNFNPWVVSGLKRREVANSAVLGALWSPMQSGEPGRRFLNEFFRRIEKPESLLPSNSELSLGYTVRTEHCPQADGKDRVDLVIETSTCVVGVEVKIDAGEGREQLSRYVTAIRHDAATRRKRSVVVLLAPFRPSIAEVLNARWKDIADSAVASLPEHLSDYGAVDHLIASFAKHVAQF